MIRIFNAKPICASKRIGQSQVILTRELPQLALPRTPCPVIALPRRMTRIFDATPIYACKEIGQLQVILTREMPQLALPRTPRIPPTQRDRSSLPIRHRCHRRRTKLVVAASRYKVGSCITDNLSTTMGRRDGLAYALVGWGVQELRVCKDRRS